jgi:hypothetical protein
MLYIAVGLGENMQLLLREYPRKINSAKFCIFLPIAEALCGVWNLSLHN